MTGAQILQIIILSYVAGVGVGFIVGFVSSSLSKILN